MKRRISLDDYDFRPVPGHEPNFRVRLRRERVPIDRPDRTVMEAELSGPFSRAFKKIGGKISSSFKKNILEPARKSGVAQIVRNVAMTAVNSATGGIVGTLMGQNQQAQQQVQQVQQQIVRQPVQVQQRMQPVPGVLPQQPAVRTPMFVPGRGFVFPPGAQLPPQQFYQQPVMPGQPVPKPGLPGWAIPAAIGTGVALIAL